MQPLLSRRRFLSLAGAAALAFPAPTARAIIERPTTVLVWEGGGPAFGGFSALDLTADRMQALAISDRGFAVRARLIRDAAGLLTGIEKLEHFSLRDQDGAAVQGRRADSEGMDLAPDGRLFVSYEGGRRARVARHATARGAATDLPRHPDWAALPGNGGLEALAVDASGAVFTIPETAHAEAFPLYRHDHNGWAEVARLPALDGFVPVGADFGPDGALYLLERKTGWRSLPPASAACARMTGPGASSWSKPDTAFWTTTRASASPAMRRGSSGRRRFPTTTRTGSSAPRSRNSRCLSSARPTPRANPAARSSHAPVPR